MSRTMTISSWSASNVVFRYDDGSSWRPAKISLVHPGHAGRRVEQTVAIGVLADGDEDLAAPPARCGQVHGCGPGRRRLVAVGHVVVPGRGARRHARPIRVHGLARTGSAGATGTGRGTAGSRPGSDAGSSAGSRHVVEVVHARPGADVLEQLGQLDVLHGLTLDQRIRERVERGAMRDEDGERLVVGRDR